MDTFIVLHSPFSIEAHKKTFKGYLEVVILENGTIEYAVPSHVQKLTAICCKKLDISAQQLDTMCPPEYYGNYAEWLCMMSKAVSVWDNFIIGDCNASQVASLAELKRHGLYVGVIPPVKET